MTVDRPRDPLRYEPRFEFNDVDQSYLMMGPSANTVAQDMALAFARDVEGKMRAALIELGWMPPDEAQRLKTAFRVNMLRHVPGATHDDITAIIDCKA